MMIFTLFLAFFRKFDLSLLMLSLIALLIGIGILLNQGWKHSILRKGLCVDDCRYMVYT